MSQPIAVTPDFLNKILTLLAPLFLAATDGDMGAAQEAAHHALIDYGARTDDELRLAALVVAFGFGSLDALSKAADKDLSLDEVMDLRDNATALSTAGFQSQTALDRLQKQRPTGARPAALPPSMEGRDLVTFARSGETVATQRRREMPGRRATMH
jgi:hypothetical protein